MSKEKKIFELEKKEICITSSQIKQAIDLLVNENTILQEEIERLKEENNILCSIANNEKEKEDKILELLNRISKAIEYIETHQLNFKKGTTTFGSERLSMEERKLLDILRGEDK